MLDFLLWHYAEGIDYYLRRFKRFLYSLYYYFSPTLLIGHLFSPWKRLIVNETIPGLSLEKRFEAFSFNLVSRIIGAFVRFILFFVSLIILVVVSVLGSFGFVL